MEVYLYIYKYSMAATHDFWAPLKTYLNDKFACISL